MESPELERAIEAARAGAGTLGLRADGAELLHSSNRIAVRLMPCDSLVRVGPIGRQVSDTLELTVAQRLHEVGSPVGEPDPRVELRVHERDGFGLTFWTHHEPVPTALGADEYATALAALHAGFRSLDVETPHFTDRVAEAVQIVTDPELSPALPDDGRELLASALTEVSAAFIALAGADQLLHGEPHLGNVLRTKDGLRFIDFETVCAGPVELDLAHALFPQGALDADDLCAHYPGTDRDAVEHAHTLIWAMITAWRWERDDQLPDRAHWANEGLRQLRARR